jgi:hypothetical protein
MVGDELEREDELFDEIVEDENEDDRTDAALLDEDEAEDEFVPESIDPDDLSSGYDAGLPVGEVDVDEDTEGDDVVDASSDEPMTEFEVDAMTRRAAHGDEIELDLDDALADGVTTRNVPDVDSTLLD